MSVQKGGTLLFVGYTRLPGNIVSEPGSAILSLELEVDSSTDLIVNASCSCIPSLGTKLIIDVLIGYDLKQTLSGPKDEIRRRFFGSAQKAVIAALEKAYEGYLRYKNSMLQRQSGKSLEE